MNVYAVELTESAAQDLREIDRHIRFRLLEPETASQQIERLRAAVFSLETMPERHALLVDDVLRGQGIRFIPVDNYLVFYTLYADAKRVYVLRILYARRDWRNVLTSGSYTPPA